MRRTVIQKSVFKRRWIYRVQPRENRWTISVSLAEGLGTSHRGDVLLEAVGLPPGATMNAPRCSQGLRQMPVRFVASADTQTGTSFIRLIAKSADGAPLDGSPQQNFMLVDRRGGFAWHSVFVDEFALGERQLRTDGQVLVRRT